VHLGYWWRIAPRKLKTLNIQLLIGVTVFSAAMYANAWFNSAGIAVMWVISVFVAVCIITVQTRSAFREAVKANEDARVTTRYAIQVWQGLYAVLTCGVMVTIVALRKPEWDVVNTVVNSIVLFWFVLGVLGFSILSATAMPVWAKFCMFASMKVIPQLCQAVLPMLNGAPKILFPVIFAGVSFIVGFLRLRVSLQAYKAQQAEQKGRFTEARSNVYSWAFDMASFVVMLVCLVVAFFTGGLLN